jgi:hypothetical protein
VCEVYELRVYLLIWSDLGYQTAQRIIRASEPLRLMQDINQNFPNLVSSLSRMQVLTPQTFLSFESRIYIID